MSFIFPKTVSSSSQKTTKSSLSLAGKICYVIHCFKLFYFILDELKEKKQYILDAGNFGCLKHRSSRQNIEDRILFSNKCFLFLQLSNSEHRSTGNHQQRSEFSVPYKSDDQFIRRWLSTLSEYRKSISHCLRWACCLSGQYKYYFFFFLNFWTFIFY